MADTLTSVMTLDENKVYRGPSRLVAGRIGLTAPTKIEDVIDPTTFVLASGYFDLGFTSDDGVSVNRSMETFDGIAIDQRKTNIYEGQPENWTMSLTCDLVDTDVATMAIVWELGDTTTLEADVGQIAQTRTTIGAPQSLTERRVAVLHQDNKTERLRMLWFRKVIPMQEDSETQIYDGGASMLPLSMKIDQDLDVTDANGPFGLVFEKTVT